MRVIAALIILIFGGPTFAEHETALIHLGAEPGYARELHEKMGNDKSYLCIGLKIVSPLFGAEWIPAAAIRSSTSNDEESYQFSLVNNENGTFSVVTDYKFKGKKKTISRRNINTYDRGEFYEMLIFKQNNIISIYYLDSDREEYAFKSNPESITYHASNSVAEFKSGHGECHKKFFLPNKSSQPTPSRGG